MAVLVFRIQREAAMHEKEQIVWIPLADWLMIAATLAVLLLAILPLVTVGWSAVNKLASGACAAGSILVAGYVLAILAHYRLVFGTRRTGPRTNPEPAERFLVWLTMMLAALTFAGVLLLM